MKSRAIKEGTVGLLLLGGVGLLAGSIFWIRGVNFQDQAYRAEVEMPEALGLGIGSAVHYRGVKVGQVTGVTPTSNGVQVGFQIRPATLLIPKNSVIETSQSGFVGQVTLSISPNPDAPRIPQTSSLTPFDGKCDANLIVCDGDRLVGRAGTNFDELIRSTTRIAKLLGEGELLQNTNVTLRNLSRAANNFSDLSQKATTTLQTLDEVGKDAGSTLTSFNQLSQTAQDEIDGLGEIKTSIRILSDSVSSSAEQFGQIGSLIQDNRGELVETLKNLNAASRELQVVVRDLGPVIGKVNESQIIENLDILAANGAEASESLKTVTSTASNPTVLLELAETLGAARTTFQNTQKITTDLEQLTGNAEFRDNLLKLINGLSKLVSSTEELQRQYNVAQHNPPVSPPKTSQGLPLQAP